MTITRNEYQGQIIKRAEKALYGLIEDAHAECLPEVTSYVEILKEYMNTTEDGMKRYCEGNAYSTVTLDHNAHTENILKFLNTYDIDAKILFVENHSGHIQIAFYWTKDIKSYASIRVSIRRDSTSIIQDIPKHTLSFDERIITGHNNGFKEILDNFAQEKAEWKAITKARRVKANAKRMEDIAEQERQEKEALAQKVQAEHDRQEARLLHAVEKRSRRCGVSVPSFEPKKYLTPVSGFTFYEAAEQLRRARSNSFELNSRLQAIQAIAEYAQFTKKPVYIEELEIMFGKPFERIIGE